MDQERFHRIAALFEQTVDLPPETWRAHLERLCPDDPPLADEVLDLLAEDVQAAGALDHNLAEFAQHLLQEDGENSSLNRQVGPYRLVRLLGEGGMGVVYLAQREDLGSIAAVKLLRDAWLSPARRERFAQEQRTLAQMQHPLIARLFDAGTLADGTPWIAMEYVEGLPLTEFCQQHALSLPARLHLLRRVCEAVQYAHGRALIHRDLKPANILATADGNIRLLDFGIARFLEEDARQAQHTRTGLRMMSPAWAAPELLRGEAAGVQCDVYALGVILYELLTGKLPARHAPASTASAAASDGNLQVPRPSVAAATAEYATAPLTAASSAERDDLDVLCLAATHPDVQRRYPSVEAFARDIDHFLRQEALEARPDSALYRGRKFVVRNRRAVVAATVALATILTLAAVFTWRLSLARDEATAQAARAQRIQAFLFQLLQGGDELAGPASELRVVSLLERGVREARALRTDPSMQSELFENLGSVYQKLGELSRAEELLEAALAQRKHLVGHQHPDTARAMLTLSLLRVDQARLEEAEQLARAALVVVRRELPALHPDRTRALSALGSVLIERGEYTQAITVLSEAPEPKGKTEPSSPADAARMLLLANAHFYAGDFAASHRFNQQVLEMRRRTMGDDHPAVADVLVNLGAIAFEKGDLPEAETHYRQALRIAEAWFGGNHPSTASILTMLGRALVRSERYDEAVATLRRALQIQEAVHGSTHPAVASAGNELATVALQRGDLAEAEDGFQRVASIYRAIHGDSHFLHGIAMSNLGSVALASHNLSLAATRYREALRIFLVTLDPSHLNVGIARLKLGRTLLRSGMFAEAETEIRLGRAIVLNSAGQQSAWLAAADKDLAQLAPVARSESP